MKKGFSLIEMLVVIGIIAVLVAVMMVSFGGSTESARAALCLSNMKALAQAANSWAMGSEYYPCAGTCEAKHAMRDGGFRYKEQTGWISWLSNHNEYGDGDEDTYPTAHQSCRVCPFYGTGEYEDVHYAITNGVIWKACGRKSSIYTCPSHVRAREQKSMAKPHWSYVMNAKFGYDYSKGSKATGTYWYPGQRKYGCYKRADRILMFAELPVATGSADGTASGDGDEYQCDCTLQYKGSFNGKEYGKEWSGEPEAIGFNHLVGKRKCANVVFADCHTEKIMYASDGLKMEELTAVLCEGLDYSFDGKEYKVTTDQD